MQGWIHHPLAVQTRTKHHPREVQGLSSVQQHVQARIKQHPPEIQGLNSIHQQVQAAVQKSITSSPSSTSKAGAPSTCNKSKGGSAIHQPDKQGRNTIFDQYKLYHSPPVQARSEYQPPASIHRQYKLEERTI
jgi:hypothetical protein